MKYKRKPVEVDAILWDGSEGAREELEKIFGGPSKISDKGVISIAGDILPFGVWLVLKPNGSMQAYAPNNFHARYEPVVVEAGVKEETHGA